MIPGAPIPPGAGGPPGPAPLPPPPQPSNEVTIDQVMALIRDDRMRSFRVDVETDSTVEADENEYKQRLTEFLTTLAIFFEKTLPVANQHPELVPFFGEVLTTTVRGYRVGRQLEGTIEDAMAQLAEKAQNPPPPQPNPVEQSKIAVAQIKARAEAGKAQAETQRTAMQAQADVASHQMDMQRLGMEQQLAAQDHAAEMQKRAAAVAQARAELAQSLAPQQVVIGPDGQPTSF